MDALLTPALVDNHHEYRHLFAIYVPIAIGVFVVVVLAMAYAVIRYRRRSPEQAARWHEHNPLEGAYAALLTLTVAFLLYLTFTAEHRVDTVANHERPALTIDVTGAKWEWQFSYPAYGFSVRSGTVGRQPLVLPMGEPIRFNLRTLDVIHGLWFPQVDFKHDLIPGSTQVVTLSFPTTGHYLDQCAEFCGLRHWDMVFPLHVVTPSQFRAWAQSRGKAPAP